jgi:hypothetical protein
MSRAYAVAPPTNDLFGNAKIISVGFSATVDTRGATTDATDKAANRQCGAPATDASVWYRITPPTDQTVILQSKGSSYSVGFIVVTGSPDAFNVETCGPRSVLFIGHAGTAYSILVFDDQGDGGGNGGSLQLATKLGPPPPSLSVGVGPHATMQKLTHAVTVTGTLTCAHAAGMAMRVDLRQRAGRLTLEGAKTIKRSRSFCDGQLHDWSVLITGNGRFAGGKATVTIHASACSRITCTSVKVQQVIQVRG